MLAIKDKIEKRFVGERLEKIRTLRGMTKVQLAANASTISVNDVHLTSNSITKYECNASDPMESTARALAEILGVSYVYLITSEAESSKAEDAIEEMSMCKLLEVITRRKAQALDSDILSKFSFAEIHSEIGRRLTKGELK